MSACYREPQDMPAEKIHVKALAAIVLSAATGTGLATVHYGQAPPDFALSSAKGSVTLSQLRGKPVVINFWASWCPPCTDELTSFTRLQHAYGSRIAIITVSNEAPGVARAYLEQKRYALPLVE
ncbi:MAG: TlpA family protein disulfide reductase, partial [Candidatus Eremiobacteraeota bacterium]|nr:TlpA family protein disulfide reductase [Candidatus Eremiobacteraeota bacterium]